MEERTGDACELGERLTVVGRRLAAGDRAPDFALDHVAPATGSLTTVRLADSAGTVRLRSVVNALDPPVCHVEKRRWEDVRPGLPPGVTVHPIGMNLPYAQGRWQMAGGVTHPAHSAHKSEQFGRAYGVRLKEGRLRQRAVFVVNYAARLVYAAYVADQLRELNDDAAVAAIRGAVA